jgi:hypothetical protein
MVEGVELGADAEALPAPCVAARGCHDLLGSLRERRPDCRNHRRQCFTGCSCRLGDQSTSLLRVGRVPVDVENCDGLAHRVCIGRSRGLPQPRTEKRYSAIESARGPKIERLLDWQGQILAKQ